MSNLNGKFKKILKELEENIQDKDSLEFVKIQMFNLYNMFFEELEKNDEINNKKILAILSTQQEMLEKINALEVGIRGIEKDIYYDGEDEFEVVCPYCNNEFEIDELRDEVICPECNNTIELDWSHNCDGHSCEGCHDCDETKEEDDM